MSEHNHQHGHQSQNAATVQNTGTALASGNIPTSPMLTTEREMKFSFKKQTVMDEFQKEVKRPPLTLQVPVPTFDGILEALSHEAEGGKVRQLLIDLVEEAIKDQVREQLADDTNPVMRQADLDLTKLSVIAIANMPRDQRSGGISTDTWDAWVKDYVETMLPLRAKEKDAPTRIAKAAQILRGKYRQVQSDKKAVQFLMEALATWASTSENVEEYAGIFTLLDNKGNELLNRDNESLLAAL